MSPDGESVPLFVTLGMPGDGSFNLRFPREHRAEIVTLLDDSGIGHGTVVELSAGRDLAIEAVRVLAVPGGLGALALVIKTFVHRHDNKRVVLKDGVIETAGYSLKEIEGFLRAQAEAQSRRDAASRRVLGEETEGDKN